MSIQIQLSVLTPFVWAVMADYAEAAVSGTPVYGSQLFRRECVKCPSTIPPLCPQCPAGQTCSLTIQTCNACAASTCVPDKLIDPGANPKSRANPAGPIVGGVVAGFTVLALSGFLLWSFLKKKKRAKEAEAEKSSAFGASRAARASTHTVASISSTTTRASNVIQIGYLPGVMNPSTPSTPGRSQFIPPVPPLPAGTLNPTIRYPQSPEPDEGTFFSAEDILRASFCTTGDHDPRSSVATTVYRSNAVVQPVAANVVRAGKAAVVTVKGGNSASSTPHIGSGPVPAVPQLDVTQFEGKGVNPTSPAFSVGSTFLNKASERNQDGPTSSRLSVPRRPIPGRTITAEEVLVESSAWEDESSEDDEKSDLQRRLTVESSPASSDSELHSPFSDRHSLSDIPLPAGTGLPPIMSSANRMSATVGIGSVSSRGSGRGTSTSGSSVPRSPFDDSNAVDRRR